MNNYCCKGGPLDGQRIKTSNGITDLYVDTDYYYVYLQYTCTRHLYRLNRLSNDDMVWIYVKSEKVLK